MHATGWHNGGPDYEAAGYGLKFTAADRDREFNRDCAEIVLELGDQAATVALSPSFWRSCPELRSADIGRWLLDIGAAPWRRSSPPGFVVNHVDGNRFTVRLLERRSLPATGG